MRPRAGGDRPAASVRDGRRDAGVVRAARLVPRVDAHQRRHAPAPQPDPPRRDAGAPARPPRRRGRTSPARRSSSASSTSSCASWPASTSRPSSTSTGSPSFRARCGRSCSGPRPSAPRAGRCAFRARSPTGSSMLAGRSAGVERLSLGRDLEACRDRRTLVFGPPSRSRYPAAAMNFPTAAEHDPLIAEVLVGEDELRGRVVELGAEISRDYAGLDPRAGRRAQGRRVLHRRPGAHASPSPCEIDFMAVSSYGNTHRLVGRRADPEGPRRRDRGPARADRRGHRRLRPHPVVSRPQPRGAEAGVARGLRAPDEAGPAQGEHRLPLRRLRDRQPVRDRLRARLRRALPRACRTSPLWTSRSCPSRSTDADPARWRYRTPRARADTGAGETPVVWFKPGSPGDSRGRDAVRHHPLGKQANAQ